MAPALTAWAGASGQIFNSAFNPVDMFSPQAVNREIFYLHDVGHLLPVHDESELMDGFSVMAN